MQSDHHVQPQEDQPTEVQGERPEHIPSQDVPDLNTQSLEMPDVDTRSHEIPGPDARSQEIPGSNTISREIPDPNTRSQEIAGQDARSQEIAGQDARSQEVPGRAGTYQDARARSQEISHMIPDPDARSLEIPCVAQDLSDVEIPRQDEPAIWNQEVTQAELMHFARFIHPEWHERLIQILGMDNEIVAIQRARHREDIVAVSFEILLEWLQRNQGPGHKMVSNLSFRILPL